MALPKEIKRMSNGIYAISDEDCSIEIYKRVNNVYEEVFIYSYTTASIPYFTYTLTQDGLYRVKLTGAVAGNLDVILPIFPTLISNTAKDFKSFVCDTCGTYVNDCGCNDISAVSKKSLKYNTLASKILFLETQIVSSYLTDADIANYHNFLLSSLQSVSCKSERLIAEILRLECLTGVSESSELYKLLLVLRFLGIYLIESTGTLDYLNAATVIDNTLPIIPDLYLYEDWKSCLCNTCLRIDEIVTIFTGGIVLNLPATINYPPTADNIVREILGVASYYNYDLLQADFSAVYNDDSTAFPAKIIIKTLPNTFILEDINDVAVIVGQEINFGDIGNYRCNHTSGAIPPSPATDYFEFVVNDGSLDSPVYRFTFILVSVTNLPPKVLKDFGVEIFPPQTVNITKQEILTSKGFVVDPEGDAITLAKMVYAHKCTLELWNGAAYAPFNVNGVITLASYSDNGQFLRVTYDSTALSATPDIRPPSSIASIPDYPSSFRLAFLDSGSNLYSDSSNIANFMSISININYGAKLVFTGGYSLKTSIVTNNWIPLARIEYNGSFKDLVAQLVNQSGYVSGSLPFMIIEAKEDKPFDIYNNSSSIIVSGTTNPTIKSYDIYVNTDVLNTRTIDFKITDGVNDLLSITSDILVKVVGNNNPVAINFLEFNETNIADFNAYEIAIPANFLSTVPNPALPINFDEAIIGKTYTITSGGLIGFSLETKELRNPVIYDNLGNDITTSVFKKFFDATTGFELYISYGVYSPSNLYLKFEF